MNPANSLCKIVAITLCLGVDAVAQPGRTPLVVVAPVVEKTVKATQDFVGTVNAVKRATVGSAVDGRVVGFPVEEGDRVKAMQPLAQLLTETISLELAAAEAELDLRKQKLAELRNGSRQEEIEQARARMSAAMARQEFAVARRKRAESLDRNASFISADELDEAIALAAEAQESYLEAKAAHALAVAGPRREVIAQAEAEVAVQRAIVQQLKDRIKKHTIISRFAGYVVAEYTEVGMWVKQGDPVAEVVSIDQVEVVAQVVEQSVPFLRLGDEVTVGLAALPGKTFTGKIAAIVNQADPRSRTFPIKIVVDNEIRDSGPLMMPGMYARVTLPVGGETVATLVPKDAVVLGGAQPIVYVIQGGERNSPATVAPVAVQLGVSSGSLIQATGGIRPGQLVVVEGNERLRPGQPVRMQRAADTSAGQARINPARSVTNP
ncbi:MAG: efflux RND transporter periplasmic adaptor subunit [Planctomycetota bacterium]